MADKGAHRTDPERLAHFRVLGRLGQGGMGIVYRAEDEKLRRTVALKVLPQAVAQDDDRRRRFLREARAAAALTHANIATVYEVDEADGRIFIAMELVEGGSLRTRLGKGAMNVSDVVRIARGVARGLARAHAKGIVHRDLKPDNVMLDEDGEAKILDFGLAKLREEQQPSGESLLEAAETASKVTQDGRLLGTPGYMAPEQVRGKPVDGRTDLFALGICMYEMLAGEVPFKGESTMDVLMAIARDAHRPVRERNADVPEALAAVVDRCLAKSPDDRYASAREVVEALEAIAISADARVPQVRSEASTKSLGATAVSENRPRGSRWVVVGLGALLVGALALGLAWRARSSPSLTGPAASAASSGAGLDAELGIGLTELPPPRTSSPEAAKEYALAAQSVNDGSFDTGRVHLVRALKLDPGFAAAHLALVFWLPNKLDDDRRHVAAAAEGRAQLSDRDATVLEVFQQLLTKGTGSMDRTSEEAWQRWTSAAARFPTDAFILQTQATAGLYSGHEAEALKILDLSRKLDPKSVWPDLDVAMYLVSSGDLEGGMAAAARCLEISPSASICHTVRAGIELRLGQCGKLEEDARAAIALEPDASNAYYYLAGALLSKGASPESVVEANRRAEERLPDAQRKALFELTDANDMASLSGDFVTALAIFPRFDQLTATLPSGQIARAVFRAESDVLFETAQTDALLALADRYVKRLPVLTTDGPLTGKEIALWVRRRSGRIPDPEFRTLQEAWAKEARDAMPPKLANAVWFDFFAEPASSPKDAQEALDALARYSPLPAYEGMVPRESAMGQVLLLAGRVDEAIPHLRRAISACLVQDYIWQHQRAAELLGEALEAKRDKEGACTAYAEVLVHWGNAKPRSVTADKARARAKSLGCAK